MTISAVAEQLLEGLQVVSLDSVCCSYNEGTNQIILDDLGIGILRDDTVPVRRTSKPDASRYLEYIEVFFNRQGCTQLLVT